MHWPKSIVSHETPLLFSFTTNWWQTRDRAQNVAATLWITRSFNWISFNHDVVAVAIACYIIAKNPRRANRKPFTLIATAAPGIRISNWNHKIMISERAGTCTTDNCCGGWAASRGHRPLQCGYSYARRGEMCIQDRPFTFKLTTIFIALNNIVLFVTFGWPLWPCACASPIHQRSPKTIKWNERLFFISIRNVRCLPMAHCMRYGEIIIVARSGIHVKREKEEEEEEKGVIDCSRGIENGF